MKVLKSITVVAMMLIVSLASAQTKKERKITSDAVQAKKVLLVKNPKLDTLFKNSVGYAIFPNVGKGGFILGGSMGNGVLVENKMLVGLVDLKTLDIGMQAGIQSMVQVIFFETPDSLEDFKEGHFEFGAQASAIALKSGASINAKYKEGVAVFVLPKAGLMADASIGGQKFGYTEL